MIKGADQLLQDRATRNAARAVFDTNLAQVKADLEARSVGGRIADQAVGEAKAALAEGLAVARESKGIVAGVLAALLAWFFRGPLIDALDGLFEGKKTAEPAPVKEESAKPRTKRRKPKETEA